MTRHRAQRAAQWNFAYWRYSRWRRLFPRWCGPVSRSRWPFSRCRGLRACVFGAWLVAGSYALADTPEFTLEIRDHLFYPTRLTIPRDTKVKLIVINRDATPEEFESYELNREKVVMGNRQAILFIGPLPRGEYPFFGEFHPKTALGVVIAE